MWLLFHRSGGTKVVSGGRTFVEECPTCERRTRFREIEVSEGFGLFFVDVVKDKERKFRCDECEDVFDLRDQAAAPAAPPPPKAKPAPLPERDRAAARERIANKIEDELAELKRRLGK
ncbi:MAG: hypothetical protein JO257_27455 [Deltaproteobacteria bacterium]|nr:hypothetical protein [Deltaproteobacteria bacterium]